MSLTQLLDAEATTTAKSRRQHARKLPERTGGVNPRLLAAAIDLPGGGLKSGGVPHCRRFHKGQTVDPLPSATAPRCAHTYSPSADRLSPGFIPYRGRQSPFWRVGPAHGG